MTMFPVMNPNISNTHTIAYAIAPQFMNVSMAMHILKRRKTKQTLKL